MKKLMISFAMTLVTVATIFAQKAPNWNAPNANKPNVGIHHDNVPPRTAKPNTNTYNQPTQDQPKFQLPTQLPNSYYNHNASATWQLSSWDNFGAYTVQLRYMQNGLLNVTVFRTNMVAQSYTSNWSYNNGVLYSNNCGWFSQGSYFLDASGRYMTFYSVWYPGNPIYLQRIA